MSENIKVKTELAVYDLSRACMTGEHWMVFEYPQDKGKRSCACGRLKRPRPIDGFVPQKPRPVYQVPTDVFGVPCNFGCCFHERAISNFLRAKPSKEAVRQLDEIQAAAKSR